MPRYAKPTVQGSRSIDVLSWNRLGYLFRSRSFSWVWKRDGKDTASICVESGRDSVTLKYYFRSYGGERSDVRQYVPLDWVPCRFGGERPWFLCHGLQNGRCCGRRVPYLYGGGKLFACRHCYRLAYESQQEPARQRGLLKAQKIRERLGGNASMLDEFPNKPKGMHWRTYDRLQRRYEAADAQSLMTLTKFVDRYAAR